MLEIENAKSRPKSILVTFGIFEFQHFSDRIFFRSELRSRRKKIKIDRSPSSEGVEQKTGYLDIVESHLGSIGTKKSTP